MKGKGKQSMTKTLILLMWLQLLLLTQADQELELLTPYGQAEKDKGIQIQEMSIVNTFTVHLDVPFKFTGRMYDTINLTKNGVITLGGVHPEDPQKASWENIPQALPLTTAYPLIAAYWTNPQITEHGDLWFQQTMDQKKLEGIKRKVQCLYPQNKDLVAKWAFIATWENITSSKNLQTVTNTFQIVLVNIEDYSYVLFQYGNLTWTSWKMPDNKTDENKTQSAVAGYNGGDGISYSMLPGSKSKEILKIQYKSNVNVSGLWIFRIDQSQEPCVHKGLAVMLLLVVLLSLLAGITLGLLLAWCFWKWKHKLNGYEDLDSETSNSKRRKSGSPESSENLFILPKKVSSVTMTQMYTSHAEVDPQNEPQEVPRRKITVIKKH